MKTAQEVANELDLTRTEVYNLLRKKRFSPLVKKNGGQVAISNELFKLLEEKNTIADVKAEESIDFTSTIEILQNQITILNNIITNNLNRILDQ